MEDSLYATFAAVERRHWWFVARRRIIEDQVKRVLAVPSGASLLDVGCGTGGVLAALSREYDVSGMDASEHAVRLCHEAGLTQVVQGTLENPPFPGKRFALVLLLDVIEHIQDDAGTLRACRDLLSQGGTLLVTVPAYQFLWSQHDVRNHHQRRYTRSLLLRRLEEAGYAVEKISYFNALLFPVALFQRILSRFTPTLSSDPLRMPSPLVNQILQSIFGSERYLLRRAGFPFGLSILAIAKVKDAG